MSAIAAQAPPIVSPQLEDLLPTSTYAGLRFGGLEACRTGAASQPMAGVVQSLLANLPPELRTEYVDEELSRLADQLRSAMQRAGVEAADLRAALGQPIVLAVGRLTIEGLGPSIALLIERGDRGASIDRVFQQLVALLPRGMLVGDSMVTEAGGTFRRLVIRDGPTVFAGPLASAFLITNSRGLLRECAAVAAGQAPGLFRDSGLGALRAALPGPILAGGFANGRQLIASLAPHMPYEAGDCADALGLGACDLLSVALAAGAGGGADQFHLGLGGSRHGLAKALVAAPVDLSFARACSPNTVLFAAGSFDVAAVVEAFGQLGALLPAGVADEVRAEFGSAMAAGLRELGTTPGEFAAISRAFGNQLGAALALEKGAVPMPELLVRIAVRDRQAVAGLLARLETVVARESGLPFRSRRAGDAEIRFMNLRLPGVQMQLSPCYALVDGALWLASDVATLVRALRLAEGDEGLAAQADFAALARHATGASGVVHVRAFRAVEIGWRAVETFGFPLLDAQRDFLGFGSELLPDSEALALALGATSYLARVDDDGVTVSAHGPLTFGALVAALGSVASDLLSRAGTRVF